MAKIAKHDILYDITEVRERYTHPIALIPYFTKDLIIRRVIPLYVEHRAATVLKDYENARAILSVVVKVSEVLSRDIPVRGNSKVLAPLRRSVESLVRLLEQYFSNPRRNLFSVPEGPYVMTPIKLPLDVNIVASYSTPKVGQRVKNDPHRYVIMGRPHYFMTLTRYEDNYVD